MLYRLLTILLFFPLFLCAQDRALEKYQEGERAKTAEERKAAFNEALTLYLQIESQSPSADLCFDIANTYFQLGEYGYAILYYKRALKESPRFSDAEHNMQIAMQKAGVTENSSSFLENYLLFFHSKLSHNEKEVTSILLLLVAFLLFSAYLWRPEPFVKKMAFAVLAIAVIFWASILWKGYFSSSEAVLVRTAVLRRDAGSQYAPVGVPAISGTTVTVLSIEPDGNWLKVRTPSGEEGYVSKENARIV